MAEPLVLLPGMMCDARLFAPQITALSGTRAIHAAPLTGAATIRELAENVLKHAPPAFALAGLSMGGIVAMEVVRQAPDRVLRLALLDTNCLPEAPEVAARREPQIAAVRNGKLVEVMRDEMKPNYLADGPRKKEALKIVMDMALGLGPEVFESQSRALQSRPDQRQTLRGVDVPTLVMCGRHDIACPIERHELIAGLIAGSDFRIIDGAGHLPVLERPDETNQALIDWLNSTPRQH